LEVYVEVSGVVFEFGHLVDAAESLPESGAVVASENADDVFDEEGSKAADPCIIEERPGERCVRGGELVYGSGVECTLCGTDVGLSAPVGDVCLDKQAFVLIGEGQVEYKVEVVFACDVEGDEGSGLLVVEQADDILQ